MKEYTVRWEIQLDADSPRDAAIKAALIQRDRDSTALVFNIDDEEEHATYRVDLMDENESDDIILP